MFVEIVRELITEAETLHQLHADWLADEPNQPTNNNVYNRYHQALLTTRAALARHDCIESILDTTREETITMAVELIRQTQEVCTEMAKLSTSQTAQQQETA